MLNYTNLLVISETIDQCWSCSFKPSYKSENRTKKTNEMKVSFVDIKLETSMAAKFFIPMENYNFNQNN